MRQIELHTLSEAATFCNFGLIDGKNEFALAGTLLQSSAAVASTNWHYYTVKFNGASSYVRRDGFQIVAGDAGANDFVTGMLLGMSYNIDGYLIGDVAELIWFTGDLSTSDLVAGESYLRTRCGFFTTYATTFSGTNYISNVGGDITNGEQVLLSIWVKPASSSDQVFMAGRAIYYNFYINGDQTVTLKAEKFRLDEYSGRGYVFDDYQQWLESFVVLGGFE